MAAEEAGAAGILGIGIVPVVVEAAFAVHTAGMLCLEEAEEEKDYWEVVGGGHWDWGDSRTQSRTIALAAEDMILVVVAARTSEMAEGSMLDIAV